MHIRRFICLSVTLGLLVLSGCNVFEGFYEEGASDDPNVILQDAQAALTDGRPADAVKYAQKVLDKTPTHIEAINTVAAAELKMAEIDIVTLQEFVDVLTLKVEETVSATSSTPLLAKGTAAAATCPTSSNYECDFCNAGEQSDFSKVDYTNLEAYQHLSDAREAFGRIEAAFDPLFVYLLEELAEIEAADLHAAFASEASRSLAWYILLQRSITSGVKNPERFTAQFLATVAIVRISTAVSTVASDAAEQQVAIYKVNPNTANETFSYCAVDLATVENYVDTSVCDQVRHLQTSINILRARQENYSRAASGSEDPIQILIDEAGNALEDYRNSESYGRCGGL